MHAEWKFGYGFSVDGRTFGMTPILPSLVRKAGYTNVHAIGHVIEFSAGTDAWIDYFRNYEVTMAQGKAMIVGSGTFTVEEYNRICQQVVLEMQDKGFWGMAQMVTVSGQKPAIREDQ